MKRILIAIVGILLGVTAYVCAASTGIVLHGGLMLLSGSPPPTTTTTTAATDACATCPDAGAGADVICEDCEGSEGTELCGWTDMNSGLPSSDEVNWDATHVGTFACTDKGSHAVELNLDASDANSYVAISQGDGPFYVSFYFAIVSELLEDADDVLLAAPLSETATITNAGVRYYLIQSGGALYIRFGYDHDVSSWIYTDGTTAISLNTWYRVTLHYDAGGTGDTDTVITTIAGETVVNTTTANLDRDAIDNVLFGSSEGPSDTDAVVVQFDLIKIDDDTMPGACPE